ncbi:BRO-N domain-containing protein [Nostoc sp.]|uniref:BRO-N domain-containing protein n=1 Tax=Nostoc sp. TaxID=1180 RepID=UPI002FF774D9
MGIQNTTQAVDKLDDDERYMFNIGRQGETWCINESGLYSLVLTSRKPQAKRFKKWLTSEVIPAIRKTGSYSATTQPIPQLSPSARLTELTNEQATIRKIIGELKQLLSNEENKLREVEKALITEAKAFQKANPDLMKQAVLCKQILETASRENPFDKSVSLK